MVQLPPDFSEFLKLLEDREVRYLLIGGYAVGYYGYPRATGDLDIWVAVSDENRERILDVLCRFGMTANGLVANLLLEKDKIIRMGLPPLRIEVHTGISGVEFEDCYHRRRRAEIGGIEVNVIEEGDLKANKRAAGRHKDLDDLEHLP